MRWQRQSDSLDRRGGGSVHKCSLGLLGGLGLLASLGLAGDGLDNTDSDSLTHVSDSETTERGVIGEGFDDHRLHGLELDHSGVLGLDKGGCILHDLTGTLVDLGDDLAELAGNVGGVAIEDGRVSVLDLTGVVKDDNLSVEELSVGGGVILGVRADVSSLDILDRQVLNVETNIVTGGGSFDLLVMHLNGLDFSGDSHGAESDDHTGLEDTSFDTTDGNCADTLDLVHILEGETEGLVGGSLGGVEGIEGSEEGGSLVPGHVGGGLEHVIAFETGDGDEGDLVGVVADLLEVEGKLGLDLIETGLGVLHRGVVHLVDGNDHLLDSHSLGQESVLSGLTVLGETGFETTDVRGDHKNSGIGLGGSRDHVLDEISVSGGINDGEDSGVGLEFPEGNIDGDTTLALGLKLVEHPGVLEGGLAHFGGFLLELLDHTLGDTSALVDEMSGRGGLARVDVADNDEIDLIFFFSHFG